jgi:Asp-tRNA(Asn)/Glu-tRNA(Gln) amidotransferase A subunit family amidase
LLLAETDGCPVGISIAGAPGADMMLLDTGVKLAELEER